jgi:hypothetical protein
MYIKEEGKETNTTSVSESLYGKDHGWDNNIKVDLKEIDYGEEEVHSSRVSTSGEDGNKNLKLYKRWIISRLAEQL